MKTSTNKLEGSKRSFAKNCASYNINSIGPKRSLETNISKEGDLPVTKDFGLLFLVLSNVTNLLQRFNRAHRVV